MIAFSVLALVGVVLGAQWIAGSGTALAANTVAQCNGVDNSGGLGLTCEVTVTNTLDLATGVASSTVTITECHGDANTVPSSCIGPTTTSYDSLTTAVNQCNDAINGGGASIICTVHVINNIVGGASSTTATINQCVGSGEEGTEPTLNCNPYPASTSGASITQCNGSVNGGGAPLRVTCTVVPGSTESAELMVLINQCNGSANGGGSIAICTTDLTTNALPANPGPSGPPVDVPPGDVPPDNGPPVTGPPPVVSG